MDNTNNSFPRIYFLNTQNPDSQDPKNQSPTLPLPPPGTTGGPSSASFAVSGLPVQCAPQPWNASESPYPVFLTASDMVGLCSTLPQRSYSAGATPVQMNPVNFSGQYVPLPQNQIPMGNVPIQFHPVDFVPDNPNSNSMNPVVDPYGFGGWYQALNVKRTLVKESELQDMRNWPMIPQTKELLVGGDPSKTSGIKPGKIGDTSFVHVPTFLPPNDAHVHYSNYGDMVDAKLPKLARHSVLSMFAKVYDVDLTELADPDLNNYESLGAFFRRSLKPGIRPIADDILTSPADGMVESFGRVTSDHLEQIKGMSYSLQHFVGPITWTSRNNTANSPKVVFGGKTIAGKYDEDLDYKNNLKFDPDNFLFQCVIYLSPGDYHHFHSPSEWAVTFRRYFPGSHLSVNPKHASRIPELYNINERVIYIGNWFHGFFAMTAVGANHVGSIKVYKDPQLTTVHNASMSDKNFLTEQGTPIQFHKGDPVGEFNLGSTMVLLFEAPPTFQFPVKKGQKIKYGQTLGI